MTPIFSLVVNLFLMGIAIWSISENLINSREHLGITTTSITSKGFRIILCALGVVFFSYWKDCNYEKDQNAERKAAIKKDAANKADIVKAVTDNSKQIVKALAEYNLSIEKKSDSLLKVVRDSARKGNVAPPEPDPRFTLLLSPMNEESKSIVVKDVGGGYDSIYTKFAAYQNDIHNLTYYSFIIFPYNNDTIVLQNLVDRNIELMANTVTSVEIETHNQLHLLDVFWLKYIGIYKNKKGEKFYLDETYIVRPKTGEYQRVSGPDVDIWKAFIKRKRDVARQFYDKKKL